MLIPLVIFIDTKLEAYKTFRQCVQSYPALTYAANMQKGIDH